MCPIDLGLQTTCKNCDYAGECFDFEDPDNNFDDFEEDDDLKQGVEK